MGRHRLKKTRHPGVFRRSDGRLVVRVKATSEKTGKPVERSRVLPEETPLLDAVELARRLRDAARQEASTTIQMPSLLDYAGRWINRKVTRGEWRQGAFTQEHVERVFRLHVMPTLGDVLLDKLTRSDLEDWMDARIATGAKPSSIRTWWITLKNLVADGCDEYGLPNPGARVRPPKGGAARRGGKEMVLLPDQIQRLLNKAREVSPDRWYLVLLLGFGSGARVGEVVAPLVRDMDLTGDIGFWTVARHAVPKRVLEGTKAGPERLVYLDPTTTGILRPHWEARSERGEDVYLFPGRMERCVTPQGLHRVLKKWTKELELPDVSSKTFRQSYVTLAALNNVEAALTMEQVGHASEAVHSIYRRVPAAPRQAAAERMGNVINLADRVGKGGSASGSDSSVANET